MKSSAHFSGSLGQQPVAGADVVAAAEMNAMPFPVQIGNQREFFRCTGKCCPNGFDCSRIRQNAAESDCFLRRAEKRIGKIPLVRSNQHQTAGKLPESLRLFQQLIQQVLRWFAAS